MKLADAADYIKGKHHDLPALITSIKRILRFPQERANRLARFIVITRAYEKGEDINRIVERYGCGRTTVLRYARMAGLPTRPKHFPAAIKRAVLRDYRRKMPVADIARLHEVSTGYVSTLARKAGLSRYNTKPRKRQIVAG